VRETTGDAYEVEVRQLAAVLADFPCRSAAARAATSSGSSRELLAMCARPYRIWTSRSTLAKSAPVCGKCHQP
jgi:hypothetical protein